MLEFIQGSLWVWEWIRWGVGGGGGKSDETRWEHAASRAMFQFAWSAISSPDLIILIDTSHHLTIMTRCMRYVFITAPRDTINQMNNTNTAKETLLLNDWLWRNAPSFFHLKSLHCVPDYHEQQFRHLSFPVLHETEAILWAVTESQQWPFWFSMQLFFLMWKKTPTSS